VTKRLSTSQAHLSSMQKIVQDMVGPLVILLEGKTDNNKFPINAGMLRDSYESFVTFANMTDEGQYLFSGINSSEKPLNGYFTK
ncbi:flagellar biosynthesis protein FlgL, partial [Candidatus Liberibacter asiaticus]